MSDDLHTVASLHTMLVDSRNGYEEAVSQSGAGDMLTLFQEMLAHRTECLEELTVALKDAGQSPDEDGSFMSLVHRTVVDLRSYFTGLDAGVIPNLIDGENNILAAYDEAIANTVDDHHSLRALLLTQRDEVRAKIAKMERLANKAAA